jgi:hypothetical protein
MLLKYDKKKPKRGPTRQEREEIVKMKENKENEVTYRYEKRDS